MCEAGYSVLGQDLLLSPFQSAYDSVINTQLAAIALNVSLHGTCVGLNEMEGLQGKFVSKGFFKVRL